MAEITKIQWTDATVNFWTGCKKVSQGCKYCYMYRDQERWNRDPSDVLKVQDKTIARILKDLNARRTEQLRNLKRGEALEPLKIFTCSWSDFFIDEADKWRDWAWQIIRENPQFQWQILTKRIERVKDCLPPDWGKGWAHVWIGATIEDNESLKRLPVLASIPAAVRFVSFEPLLEKLNFSISLWAVLTTIDWAIIGGESGNENGKYLYRPVSMEAILNLRDDLSRAKVPIFMKQLGTYLAKTMGLKDKRAGGDITEWPESLQIREFPRIFEMR